MNFKGMDFKHVLSFLLLVLAADNFWKQFRPWILTFLFSGGIPKILLRKSWFWKNQ